MLSAGLRDGLLLLLLFCKHAIFLVIPLLNRFRVMLITTTCGIDTDTILPVCKTHLFDHATRQTFVPAQATSIMYGLSFHCGNQGDLTDDSLQRSRAEWTLTHTLVFG